MAVPFWSGKNAKVTFLQDNTKVPVDVTSWSVKRNATKVNDGVGGEDRDRLDSITNYFDISLTCKQVGIEDLKKLLEDIDNEDALVAPLDKALAFTIKPNDGSKASFVATEVTVDDWDWASGGRTERQTLTIPLRARYFREVSTV